MEVKWVGIPYGEGWGLVAGFTCTGGNKNAVRQGALVRSTAGEAQITVNTVGRHLQLTLSTINLPSVAVPVNSTRLAVSWALSKKRDANSSVGRAARVSIKDLPSHAQGNQTEAQSPK